MKAVIQRVKNAEVVVDERSTGKINLGLLVLLGVCDDDSQEDINWLVNKIINLRIFSDNDGKMNLSLNDVQGNLLVVSQFTLYASTKKGNRPSYIKAAKPEYANEMYEKFIKEAEQILNKKVERGIFGGDMKVSLLNDGPVTIIIDTKNKE